MRISTDAGFSPEEANLFNPAYCAVLVYGALTGYRLVKPGGMSCLLPYLILPMAISKEISVSLPSSVRSSVASWAVEHEGSLVGLPGLAESFIPVVDAAMGLLLERSVVSCGLDGRISTAKVLRGVVQLLSDDVVMARNYSHSTFLGKWFACVDSDESIFLSLGVRP